MSDRLLELRFKNVYTISTWNKETNEYCQSPDLSRLQRGQIRRSLLEKIVELNVYVLAPLMPKREPKLDTRKVVGALIDELVDMAADVVKVFECKVSEIGPMVHNLFVNVCVNTNIMGPCKLILEHDEKTTKLLRVLESLLTSGPIADLTDPQLLAIVQGLQQVNDTIFPKYSSGVLLSLLNQFYIIFCDFKCNKPEIIMTNVLMSYAQRICYSETADDIIVKYMLHKMGLRPGKVPRETLVRNLCANKTLQGVLPILALGAFLTRPLTYESMIQMYYRAAQHPHLILAVNNQYDFDENLDLFPYALCLLAPRKERLKAYAFSHLNRIKLSLGEETTRWVNYVLVHFNELYEQVYFPNRAMTVQKFNEVLKLKPETNPNVVINLNEFENERISTHNLIAELVSILASHRGSLSSVLE